MKASKLYFCITLLSISFLMFWACSDTIEPFDENQLELEFYPLSIGKAWEYKIDSTLYDSQSLSVISTTSYTREEIIEMDTIGIGEERFIISRFWKRNIKDDWTPLNLWTASRNATQAFRTEENLRFVKLIFPPRQGASWDGNAFIRDGINVNIAGQNIEMFKNWDYQIENRIDQEQIGILEFKDIIEVTQAADSNAIELRFSQEKYAKDIGLVYREQRILDTQCIDACEGQTWEEKAQKGFIMRQTIMSFE